MKKGFQDGLARLVPEIGLTRYAESGNPLFLWEMVAELADLHFQKGINEENTKTKTTRANVQRINRCIPHHCTSARSTRRRKSRGMDTRIRFQMQNVWRVPNKPIN
jgi:hypothetical protein